MRMFVMMRSQMVLSALRCTWEATCDRIKHAWKQRDRPSLILVSCVRRDCVMCCVSVCQTVIYTFCVTLNASFVADWHTVEFATAHCRILRGTLYLPQTPCMSVEVDARRRTVIHMIDTRDAAQPPCTPWHHHTASKSHKDFPRRGYWGEAPL